MADSLIPVDPPKTLYLREISPEVSMQRMSFRHSCEVSALILMYKQDLLRRSPPTCLSTPRIDDRTLGVVSFATDEISVSITTTSVTRVIHVKPKAWLRVDINGKYIPTLRVIEKSLRGIKSEISVKTQR